VGGTSPGLFFGEEDFPESRVLDIYVTPVHHAGPPQVATNDAFEYKGLRRPESEA